MVRIPEKDPGEVAAEAAAAATAGALAKVAAKQAEKASETADVAMADAPTSTEVPSNASSVRFFVRGLGSLGEHHLRDYFQKFGTVVEASLVRDKKTQRPRGMAFVSIAPKKTEDGPAPTADELVEIITGADSHSIKDVEIEVQEALPKPDEEKKVEPEKEKEVEEQPAPVPQQKVAPLPAIDYAAQAKAQAQWQMHYLAMAINLSVPDMAAGPPGPPPGKGGGKGAAAESTMDAGSQAEPAAGMAAPSPKAGVRAAPY
mmetsp:Transcript_25899/g.53113  ORF Transcript_25899/g.53113 Transcript_25899/m.53113 type:complete len:259 (-) Transcript_25899:91-867(-)|eukprot:s811_g3.t1